MGMFDEYVPDPPLRCPKCGTLMGGWQGKDGPCDLLVWRQGHTAPVDHAVDPQWRLPEDVRSTRRLPRQFLIYHGDRCRCSAVYVAIGETDEEGRWIATRIVTTDEGRSFYDPDWRT
jgi:hypothetical protein